MPVFGFGLRDAIDVKVARILLGCTGWPAPLLFACNKNPFFSCVEVNVYPCGGKSYCFKPTKIKEESNMDQYMEIKFFNPLCSNELSHAD